MNKLLERYKELGQDIDPSKLSLKKTIRINTLKINAEALISRLAEENVKLVKVPFLDFGYSVESSEFSVGAAPEHLFGYYYVQETASQLPAQILKPSKNDVVLDMSAAPGGKTTQLAQYMENSGTIIALDNNNMRLMSLRNNIERMGVTNTILYQKDAKFAADLGIKFDKILLDAPCSGNFTVDKTWLNKRKPEDFKKAAKIQKQLLMAAFDVLKPGGELVYSTCSLEPEENEFVVNWVLETFPEIKLQPVEISAGDEGLTDAFGNYLSKSIKYTKRFWPNKTGTQGFYIAKFKKEEK